MLCCQRRRLDSCCWLWLFCVSFWLKQTAASPLLSIPALEWSLMTPTNVLGTDDLILEGNGVTIDANGLHAYITTYQGKLLDVSPLGRSAKTQVRFAASSSSLGNMSCTSGVVLYREEFAVYAVTDRNTTTVSSRIFIVPLRSNDTVRVLFIPGKVKGTPLINPDGQLFVVHDITSTTGRVSVFDLNYYSSNPNASPPLLAILPMGNDAKNVLAFSPATMTRILLDDGLTSVDWILLGENENDGLSTNGNLYALRFDPIQKTSTWIVLAQGIGSMKKAPAIANNGTVMAVGGARNVLRVWVDNSNLRTILRSSSPPVLSNVSASFSVRLSAKNSSVVAQPLILGNKIIVPDVSTDTIAYGMYTKSEVWRISTYAGHTTTPIVWTDVDSGRVVLYDLSNTGVLRQAELDKDKYTPITINYQANCLGYLNASLSDNNTICGPPTLADFALTRDGSRLVYVGATGRITVLRVTAAITTVAPSRSPPSMAPSLVNSSSGTNGEMNHGGSETNAISQDSSSHAASALGNLAIIFAVLAGVLFLAIVGAAYRMRKRNKDNKRNEQTRIQQELNRRNAWISRKLRYEEEIKQEEQETLNDLIGDPQSQAANVPQALPTKPETAKKRKKIKGRRPSGQVVPAKTLGSISESECEEVDEDESGDDQSGFEMTLDNMELGSNVSKNDVGKSVTNEKEQMDGETSILPLDSSSQHESQESQPVANTSPTRDNHRRWFEEIQALRASMFQQKGKDYPPTTETAKSPLVVRTTETIMPRSSPRESTTITMEPVVPRSSPRITRRISIGRLEDSDDEPGLIPTVRRVSRGSSAQPVAPVVTPTPQSPEREKSPMSSHDLMSVDGSLYLEGSTISQEAASKPYLPPPDGGSVISTSSEIDTDAEEFFQNPFKPGWQYLAQSRDTANTAVQLSYRGENGRQVRPVSPILSPYEPVATLRPQSLAKETARAQSPTLLMNEKSYGAQPSRAGLFTRQRHAAAAAAGVDRMLPRHESEGSVNASELETESELSPPSPKIFPPKPKPPKEIAMNDPTRPLKHTNSSIWSTFMSELSKVETQFFNPSLPGSKQPDLSRAESPQVPLPTSFLSPDEDRWSEERKKPFPSPNRVPPTVGHFS